MHVHIIKLFLPLLIVFSESDCHEDKQLQNTPKFEIEYQWTFLNFTWKNQKMYDDAIKTQKYIPEKNAMGGIKIYKDKLYVAVPRFCDGSPVTLGYISIGDKEKTTNRLISPFPDWDTNDLTSCDKLESVQSMEIDSKGTMWVLDGLRQKPDSKCPTKLVLFDLENSKRIHSYTFPDEICLSKGGFLNDIVVDESDGGFAYITDNSNIDPGLIVYSRAQNQAWKFRVSTMFAETQASNFHVDDIVVPLLLAIDGIALSPKKGSEARYVYFCALTAFSLYSISTDILKNKDLNSKAEWRFNVTYIGKKQSQSDGIGMDNKGNLYYGLLPLYGIGRWNIYKDFSTAEIVDQNRSTMVWPDSFSFDNKGSLYMLADRIGKFVISKCQSNTKEINYRIFKGHTGTLSYLH